MDSEGIVHNCRLNRMLAAAAIVSLSFLLYCSEEAAKDDRFRDFWVIDTSLNYATDPDAWYRITAEKKADSAHSIVYVDGNEPQITHAIAAGLASEFETSIYPNITQNFASPLDVDGNGKIILLIYDIVDEFYHDPWAGSYISGYFFSVDMYSGASMNDYNSANGTVYKTNQADMLYIDCDPQLVPDEGKGTIAHEFQHLVNYSYYLQHKNPDNFTDTWIDEGLAEAANHLCFGVLQERVADYNSDAGINRWPLFYWDYAAPLHNYSKSYLFFQYMKAQSASGNGIFKKIIERPEGDFIAIRGAMALDDNLKNWDSDPARRFEKLILRWYAANNSVVAGNDLYSYKNVLDPHILNQNLGGSAANLRSGAGIVKAMGSVFDQPGAGFIYLGVSGDGLNEDFTADPQIDDHDFFIAVFENGGSTGSNTGTTALPVVFDFIPLSGAAIVKRNAVNRANVPPRKPQKIDMVLPGGIAGGIKPLDGGNNE